jgi:uncharacterized damage-inducible protein DinB
MTGGTMTAAGRPSELLMSDPLIARFRRWFDYEEDSHAKVVASLDTVPTERKAGAEYRKAVAIFAHVVMARRIWLGRLGVLPPAGGTLFPDNPELTDVVRQWDTVRSSWREYLAGLTDAELERKFEYQSLDAGRFRNRVEEIMTQLFGHSSYHRGQMAVLVKAAGGTPAITDFVYWCREPVGG